MLCQCDCADMENCIELPGTESKRARGHSGLLRLGAGYSQRLEDLFEAEETVLAPTPTSRVWRDQIWRDRIRLGSAPRRAESDLTMTGGILDPMVATGRICGVCGFHVEFSGRCGCDPDGGGGAGGVTECYGGYGGFGVWSR